jgi:hypothetical protein
MHPRAKLDQPPRLGAWLLGLFIAGEEKDLIVGDLSEEYFERDSHSDRADARRWYWRQILKTLPHLVGSAFRTSPWWTALAIIVGFEFRRLLGPLPQRAIFAIIERTNVFENHYGTYKFLASTGIDIGHLITFLMVGLLVGLIARRREMAPALALGLIYTGMAVVASVWFVMKSHEFAYLLRMSWYFSDAFAVVIGAGLVRTLRWNSPRLAPQG